MNVLVVAPHADDETIGAGGTMLRYRAEGHNVDLVVCVVGMVKRREEQVKATANRRTDELAAAAKALGVRQWEVLFEGIENKLDSLPLLDVVAKLDAILDRGYDQVFFPLKSHHQDHRVIHDACYAALRQGARSNPPSLIAAYEYAYNGWYPDAAPAGRMYVDISAYMDAKKAVMSEYASQLYPPPHPISIEAIDALGRTRGVECGRPYAEMFQVARLVV